MSWSLTNVTTSVDLSSVVEVPSLVVTQRAYADTSRLSARIRDEAGTISILQDHEMLLQDGAQKVFAGFVRQLRKEDTGVAGQRVYVIECQDYSTLLADDYVPVGSGLRTVAETDKARITWLFATFGTRGVAIGASVLQVKAVMPGQDFYGKTLHQCLTMIAALSGASFYVDYDKVLHYFTTESNAAPFGLSDAPNGSTTFGYENFSEASDTVAYINEVHVIGAPGISATRYVGGTAPAAGARRGTVLEDPEIADVTTANDRGDSLINSFGVVKKPSTLVTYKAGLRAGMYVQVTHSGWSISAVSYRIAAMSARPTTKDRIAYAVDFGNSSVDLGSLMGSTIGAIVDASVVAASAKAATVGIADLSVGGANLVPNSSFEDGTSWVVGAQWVIGFTPTGGQLAFAGTDTARAALSAQTAGDLVTPKIAVDRGDEYVVSFWRYVRSRTSGTFRAFVKEYSAADALLATTNVDFVVADTDWERTLIRFAPAAAINPTKIAWQTTTAKVEIGFNSAGAVATLTVDVDGVQLERGEAPTAYAPAPGEILPGTIGTTQIADDAVTTPKLVAEAITSAKIAAGTITADKLAATIILGSLIRTGELNNRVELDSNGFRVYSALDDLLVNMPTDDSPVYVNGEIVADVLQVIGNATFRGISNTLVNGSALILDAQTEPPDAAPTLASGFVGLSVAYNATYDELPTMMKRYGLAYDAAGGAAGTTKVFWTAAIKDALTVNLVEMLATTRAVNRAVTLPLYPDTGQPFSVVRHSTWVYVLYKDLDLGWIVRRYVAATLALANTYVVDMTGLPDRHPVITADGTTIYIVDCGHADGRVKWNTYSATMVRSATVDSGYNLAVGDSVDAAYAGSADFGAFRMVVVSRIDKIARVFNSTPAVQANEQFPVVAGTGGLTYGDALADGARFWHMPAVAAPAAFTIRKHTTWVWTTASSIYWVAYSWYDSVGTVHETTVSPRKSITMGRRQQLIVTGPAVPTGAAGVDDPDRRRVYILPSATAPATTALKLQGDATGLSLVLTGYAAAGAAPPTTNNFPAGTPAELRARGGEWEFRGDGTIGRVAPTGALGYTGQGTGTFTGGVSEWSTFGRMVVFRVSFEVVLAGSGAVTVGVTTGLPASLGNVVVQGDRGAVSVARLIARMVPASGTLNITEIRNEDGFAVVTGADLVAGQVYSFCGAYLSAS